ncbi:MAG TPA: hypothetical protein VF655_12990 [Allosphingosinicella sp.]|jgi:hypothetical protein
MVDEKDPFRAAEAQAKQQQHAREEASEGEQAQQGQQTPTTADFEKYDEEVGENVKGISGASAGGPAV